MTYRLVGLDGPFGDEIETYEAACAALRSAIEEATLANMRDGDMPRATAESAARTQYSIVDTEDLNS